MTSTRRDLKSCISRLMNFDHKQSDRLVTLNDCIAMLPAERHSLWAPCVKATIPYIKELVERPVLLPYACQ